MTPSATRLTFALLLAGACSEGAPDTTEPPPGPPLLVVQVQPPVANLAVGTSLQMSASSPQLPDAVWQWSVLDSTRASVSVAGVLLAKQPGTTRVLACSAPPVVGCGSATVNIAELLIQVP